MTRKFRYWTHLNDEGKQIFGDIFPDGIVPIKEVLMPSKANLSDQEGNIIHKNIDVYRIDWGELIEEQRKACVHIIAKNNNVDDAIVYADVSKQGFIPLRAKFTSGAGTNNIGLFL